MSDESCAAWGNAVARAALGEVAHTSRCSVRGRPAIDDTSGVLYLGQFGALFTPQSLLGEEFDPDSPELLRLRYADYPVVLIEQRWLVPTATVRLTRQLTVTGPRTSMALLYEFWLDDKRFDRSIEENWA